MAQLPMLLLDVPIASEAELNFLAALCSSASEMLITAPAADQPTLARVRDTNIEDLDQLEFASDSSGSLCAAYALPLIKVLDGLPALAHWGEWVDQLSALRWAIGSRATRALRQPNRVLSVLAELARMARVGAATLQEVLLALSDLLLEVAVPPPSQRHGRGRRE